MRQVRAFGVAALVAAVVLGCGCHGDGPGGDGGPDASGDGASGTDANVPGTDAVPLPPDAGFLDGTPIDVSGWSPCAMVATYGMGPVPFLLDTGSPVTALDTSVYGGSPGPVSVDLAMFGTTFSGWGGVLFDLYGPPPPGAMALSGGIVGGDFFSLRVLTIDYQGSWGWLFDTLSGDPWVDVAVGASYVAPFEVLGGGTFTIPGDGDGTVPATRVTLDATIEGTPVEVLLDTGASVSIIDEAFWSSLGDPARPLLDGVNVLLAGGQAQASVSRVASICVGAACVSSAPVMMIPGTGLFGGLAGETGRTISLLLGGTFLRYFLTTVNYPATELRLAPYTSTSHVSPNEWVGPGINVRLGVIGDFIVTDVYGGSPAEAAGIVVGDYIAELDGVDVGAWATADAFRAMLTSYPVGTIVNLGVRMGPSIVAVPVMIADLLPAYP